MTECAQEARQNLAGPRDTGLSAAQQLHDAVRDLAAFTLASPERVRLLDTAAGLPPEAEQIARELNRLFFADLRALIQRGIEAGELRPVDEGVAAHAIVGSTRSLAWWFDPAGPRSAAFVADQIADTALRGLFTDSTGRPAPEVAEAVASLQRDVDVLTRSLLGRTATARHKTGRGAR
jgi:AcrR family transcriptional regulator